MTTLGKKKPLIHFMNSFSSQCLSSSKLLFLSEEGFSSCGHIALDLALLQLIIYRNVIFFPSLIPSVWRIFLYSCLMSLLPYIILVLIFSQTSNSSFTHWQGALSFSSLFLYKTKADYQITAGTVTQNTICLLPFPAADGQGGWYPFCT